MNIGPFTALRSQWDTWILFHNGRALFEAQTFSECETWVGECYSDDHWPESPVLIPRAPGIVPMGD